MNNETILKVISLLVEKINQLESTVYALYQSNEKMRKEQPLLKGGNEKCKKQTTTE